MSAPSTPQPNLAQARRWWTPRRRSLYAILAMCLAVVVTYVPAPPAGVVPAGAKTMLTGFDFNNLHNRRLHYAREALFGPQGSLPGWYTRELGGSPFWSNVQNFPFIPTRLPLVLLQPENAFAVGVQTAAVLAALFTFFFCRRRGIGRVGAAAAGWTFACAGFYASRVMAGHLPLLEAYPSLPLLLWLIEVNLQSDPNDRRRPLKRLALAAAACCVALAGHPQLPFYSFLTAGLYLLWRARSRHGILLALTIGVGIGMASFSLWPTMKLIAYSTRVLALDPPPNDLSFPYGRLAAFLFPWRDGWPAFVNLPPPANFTGYPDISYFWDTVCYVGWLPLIAVVFLLGRSVVFAARPGRVGIFFAVLGSVALLLALPWWQAIMSHIPGTILRSPSRQIYLTTFALALTLGFAIDVAVRFAGRQKKPLVAILVAAALAFQLFDLGYRHDRAFVITFVLPADSNPPQVEALKKEIGQQRIAIDYSMQVNFNRWIDDVGFFDSIILAKPYRALLEVSGAPPKLNIQNADGAQLSLRALQFFGVTRVLTSRQRPDLRALGAGNLFEYEVPGAMSRAILHHGSAAQFLSKDEIHRRLQNPDLDLSKQLLLPIDAARPKDGPAPTAAPGLTLERPSTDEIVVKVTSPWPGYLRLLDTWAPGWSATIDGQAAPVIPAYDTFIALPISPGNHEVRLTFATPGVIVGFVLSGLGLLGLVGLCWLDWRGQKIRAPALRLG